MSRGPFHVVLLVVAVFVLPILVHAQSISLPLDGYYRPDAHFPVALNSKTPATIRADNSLATEAPAMNGVVPVFVLSAAADQVRCGDQSLALRALGDDDLLVGCATRDEPLVRSLFPSQRVIVVDLDPTHPLPGPAIAWDALDAVVVDSIDSDSIAPLLATGMVIAVRSESRPDDTWPWKRVEDAWVLRPNASDRPALLGDSAYDAIAAWMPSRSPAARQMVMIIAVLCGCCMLAISLWRSKWALPAMAVFVVVFCAVFQAVRAARTEVLTKYDGHRIAGDVSQFDCWGYQTSPVDADADMPCDGVTWPVFASPAHAAMLNASMVCDETGNPRAIRYHLRPGVKMAFVARSVTPSGSGAGDGEQARRPNE